MPASLATLVAATDAETLKLDFKAKFTARITEYVTTVASSRRFCSAYPDVGYFIMGLRTRQ